jgi:hypothetical protein
MALFNPKPEAMAHTTDRGSIPPHAFASGFGLNTPVESRDPDRHAQLHPARQGVRIRFSLCSAAACRSRDRREPCRAGA